MLLKSGHVRVLGFAATVGARLVGRDHCFAKGAEKNRLVALPLLLLHCFFLLLLPLGRRRGANVDAGLATIVKGRHVFPLAAISDSPLSTGRGPLNAPNSIVPDHSPIRREQRLPRLVGALEERANVAAALSALNRELAVGILSLGLGG